MNDQFTADDWIPTFVLRLLYKDRELIVDRLKMMRRTPTSAEAASYRYVFDYSGDELKDVTQNYGTLSSGRYADFSPKAISVSK